MNRRAFFAALLAPAVVVKADEPSLYIPKDKVLSFKSVIPPVEIRDVGAWDELKVIHAPTYYLSDGTGAEWDFVCVKREKRDD